MKKIFLLFTMITASLVLSFYIFIEDKSNLLQDDYVLDIYLDKEIYKPGDDIKVSVEIENISSNPIYSESKNSCTSIPNIELLMDQKKSHKSLDCAPVISNLVINPGDTFKKTKTFIYENNENSTMPNNNSSNNLLLPLHINTYSLKQGKDTMIEVSFKNEKNLIKVPFE